MDTTARPEPALGAPSRARPKRSLSLAAAWSLVATAIGGWWLVRPGTYPFGPGDPGADQSLLGAVPHRVGATALLALGVVGVVLATGLRRSAGNRTVHRLGTVMAATYAVGFGLLVPDIQALIVVAYLFVLGGSLALAGVLVAGALAGRRSSVVAIATLAGLAVVGWLTGFVSVGILWEVLSSIGAGFVRLGMRPVYVFFFLLGGLVWAAVALSASRRLHDRCAACGRPAGRWTTPEAAARWGRWVTVGAALCPLPYALLRLTWLTPWPIGFDADELASTPGIRLFGLGLGMAAVAGSVLTLGLIQRWGEVWPRWVPRLAGRRVPVAAAVVPGLVVAVLLAVAGHSLTQQTVLAILDGDSSSAWLLLALPFPLWAPLLALATVAYYLRRRGSCARCGQR